VFQHSWSHHSGGKDGDCFNAVKHALVFCIVSFAILKQKQKQNQKNITPFPWEVKTALCWAQ